MRNCMECNHKFRFIDRFKSILNLRGYLTCPNCNSVYKPKINVYKAIYYFLVTFIALRVFDNIVLTNSALEFILYMVIVVPILLLFDILPHGLDKYTKQK